MLRVSRFSQGENGTLRAEEGIGCREKGAQQILLSPCLLHQTAFFLADIFLKRFAAYTSGFRNKK
jgi:hypothetical protein